MNLRLRVALAASHLSTRAATIVDTRDDYTDVRMIAPSIKVQDARIPSSVVIVFVREPSDNRPDTASALENSLDYWRTQDDFELVGRSAVEIAGIRARG